eukprot:5105915-Pyramimonas_sp.AAC.1
MAGGEIRRLPVVTRDHDPGDIIVVLQAPQTRAAWMPPRSGCFPCPRTDDSPTARWSSSFCRECGLHTTTLIANADLGPGDEVTVRSSPFSRLQLHPMAL